MRTTDAKPWPPVLAVRGPGGWFELHSHHAMHFVLAFDGELKFRTSRSRSWERAGGVLTAPDSPHAIDSRGTEFVVIFFAPESDAGATFQPAIENGIHPLSRAERNDLVRGIGEPTTFVSFGAEEWLRRAATRLGIEPQTSNRTLHPAVRKLLHQLNSLDADDDHSLDALASAVGLSGGRLMHVFTESVGIPLRPYLSWLRVQRAACGILTGATLTEAAHAAGFADASHLSRTFKRRLGVKPSTLRSFSIVRSSGRNPP